MNNGDVEKISTPAINNERVLYAGRALPLAFLFTILLALRHLCLYASVCTACKCIDLCVSALCMQQRNILLSSIITIVVRSLLNPRRVSMLYTPSFGANVQYISAHTRILYNLETPTAYQQQINRDRFSALHRSLAFVK
jgi:hypothetical protein